MSKFMLSKLMAIDPDSRRLKNSNSVQNRHAPQNGTVISNLTRILEKTGHSFNRHGLHTLDS
ncbi:hypothetical protein SO180_26430 [Bradyrhizobium sp. UFLA05-112]